MSISNEYKQDFLLLLEAGFIAINQLDENSAIKLLKAAEVLDKTNPMIPIGRGYLHLHKLELNKAIVLFKEVLKKDPNNEMAKSFLGIAYSMTPNKMQEGEKLLEDTLKSDEKDIKKLAGIALDFIDRFVRKEPSPVEVKKKKEEK